MTENTKTGPLREVCALITRIKGVIYAQVGAVGVNSNGHGFYAGARKILSL